MHLNTYFILSLTKYQPPVPPSLLQHPPPLASSAALSPVACRPLLPMYYMYLFTHTHTTPTTIAAPPGASSASTCTGTPGSRSSPGRTSGAHSESLQAPPFRPCVLSFSSLCLCSIHRTAIHVRRGDFAGWCPTTQPVDECFAPLSTYARRVEEVREELQHTRGIEVQRVVLTSDETNATWWEEVAAYGWHRVDHSTTAARPRESGAKEVGGGEQRRAKPRLGYSERIMVPFELRGVPRRSKAGGRRRATSGVVEAEAARCGAAPHVVGAKQC
ncbi:hypothetical protein B0H14DRAFT_3559239 [Mycena olivaceomarginata]|nr:hypothetical protein B0H14DRAFT_3559239 [Mycena olivaceomarginata]